MPKPLTMWITTNCKILKEIGIPDQTTWPASWEIYMQVKKQQLEPDREQWTGSKLGKGYVKVIYCHPVYLTYIQSISYEMPGWVNHKLKSRFWEKYQQPQICRWYHANGRKWRGTKESFDEGERGEWKNWLKTQHSENEDHGIWSHHFMADGETMEMVKCFIILGSKITADSDYSHEVQRCLLGRKAMNHLDSIFKSRDITLLTKVQIVKARFFFQ